MKVSDILTSPDTWIKGAYAVNSVNEPVFSATAKDACKWCLVGAVRAAYKAQREDGIYTRNDELDTVMDKIMHQVNGRCWSDIMAWNDHPKRTFADVQQLIDKLDI